DAIATEKYLAPALVQDGEGEHATQPMHTLGSPRLPGGKDDLRVGARAESRAACLELLAQRRKVVDLAVEDDPDRVVGVRHRLGAGHEVDDRQPTVAEPDTSATDGRFPVGAPVG